MTKNTKTTDARLALRIAPEARFTSSSLSRAVRRAGGTYSDLRSCQAHRTVWLPESERLLAAQILAAFPHPTEPRVVINVEGGSRVEHVPAETSRRGTRPVFVWLGDEIARTREAMLAEAVEAEELEAQEQAMADDEHEAFEGALQDIEHALSKARREVTKNEDGEPNTAQACLVEAERVIDAAERLVGEDEIEAARFELRALVGRVEQSIILAARRAKRHAEAREARADAAPLVGRMTADEVPVGATVVQTMEGAQPLMVVEKRIAGDRWSFRYADGSIEMRAPQQLCAVLLAPAAEAPHPAADASEATTWGVHCSMVLEGILSPRRFRAQKTVNGWSVLDRSSGQYSCHAASFELADRMAKRLTLDALERSGKGWPQSYAALRESMIASAKHSLALAEHALAEARRKEDDACAS